MLSNFFGNHGFFSDRSYESAPYYQVRESDAAAQIELEVPRYHQEDLNVNCDVDHGQLTVTGKHVDRSDPNFHNLVYATTSLGNFRRTFSFEPTLYDVSKFSTKLVNGIFSITVPKKPQAQPLTVFGGNDKGQLVTTTTPKEFSAVCNSRWPPQIRHEETAQALTYKCDMPPSVRPEHIQLSLTGRALTLSIGYEYTSKSKDRQESQSLYYSTTLGVPQGTTAKDITTAMDNGVLTITLAKHQTVPVLESNKDGSANTSSGKK
jgi:HSP20 family molecular chaperone IbpA